MRFWELLSNRWEGTKTRRVFLHFRLTVNAFPAIHTLSEFPELYTLLHRNGFWLYNFTRTFHGNLHRNSLTHSPTARTKKWLTFTAYNTPSYCRICYSNQDPRFCAQIAPIIPWKVCWLFTGVWRYIPCTWTRWQTPLRPKFGQFWRHCQPPTIRPTTTPRRPSKLLQLLL